MKKMIALLLALCCLLPCAVACNDGGDNSGGNTQPPVEDNGGENNGGTEEKVVYTLENIALGESSLSDYVIVYGNNDTKELNKALAEKLSEALASANGGQKLNVVHDGSIPVEKEILVGKTGRKESKYFFEGDEALDLMEYVIASVNGKIVVTGAMLFSTEQAINAVKSYVSNNSKLDGMPKAQVKLHSGFAKNSGEYRVMQYNVLVEFPGWGVEKVQNPEVEVRKEIVASMVLGYSPDAVVFCEVFENWSEQLPKLLDDEYAFVAWTRNDGTTSNRTPIAYKKDRFNLVESGYEDIAIKTSTNYRVVTYAVLEDKQTKEKLIVFGTHFESTTEDDRVSQVSKLKTAMDKITAKHSGTVVLMGDFNTGPKKTDHRAYDKLKSTFTNLKNALESNVNVSIDHIFVDKTVTVTKNHIETSKYAPFASDHKPTICDIKTN